MGLSRRPDPHHFLPKAHMSLPIHGALQLDSFLDLSANSHLPPPPSSLTWTIPGASILGPLLSLLPLHLSMPPVYPHPPQSAPSLLGTLLWHHLTEGKTQSPPSGPLRPSAQSSLLPPCPHFPPLNPYSLCSNPSGLFAITQTHEVHFHLRAFALAVPLSRMLFPLYPYGPSPPLELYLNVTVSVR